MVNIDVKDLKSLREALCVGMSAIGQVYGEDQVTYKMAYIRILNDLTDKIDVLRPLGPNGKHGNRHTEFCGCDYVDPTEERAWTIWGEGYRATGEHGDATFMGTEYAVSFDEAVQKLKAWYPNPELFRRRDDGTWTYWACKLYDNETDARRNYG